LRKFYARIQLANEAYQLRREIVHLSWYVEHPGSNTEVKDETISWQAGCYSG
jgi:hypothetical protein